MKRVISLILIFVMMLSLSTTVLAQEEVNLYVDKKYVQNANGFIENGRTMVPVRALAERMNAEVIWIENERKVVLNKPCDKMEYNGTTYENVVAICELILEKAEIRIKLSKDGKEIFNVLKRIDCIANAINGRTHIPARFVGYALGYSVEYKKELSGHNVYYDFIGKQTIDFEVETEETKPDAGNDKYPDTFVYDEERVYPSRKGYEDVIIVDASNGRIEDGKFVNLIPYEFTAENVIIEADKKEYEVSKNNTPEQNFDNFTKFYKDKTGENVKIKTYSNGVKLYKLEYLTNISNGFSYTKIPESYPFFKYIKNSNQLYSLSCINPIFDWSKMYFYYNGKSGDKVYGSKDDSFLRQGSTKNALLFLNEFLGESGQRLWKMMSDYYTMSGHFYVHPETHWTKMSSNPVGQVFPDNCDPISKENVEKYGFKFVASEKDLQHILVIENEKQRIYIEYTAINLNYALTSGYTVYFETIEN